MLGNAVTAKIAAQAALITRQQIELDAWRMGRLYLDGSLFDPGAISIWTRQSKASPSIRHDTITAAIDALMEESNA